MQQAPISVLEFAHLAHDAGVPPSVLTVLTGTGEALGRTLVTDSAVKKVDITVGVGQFERTIPNASLLPLGGNKDR